MCIDQKENEVEFLRKMGSYIPTFLTDCEDNDDLFLDQEDIEEDEEESAWSSEDVQKNRIKFY